MRRKLLKTLLVIPLLLLGLHTLLRIIRYFHKFPMPQWMANAIDNPLRRRIQPPGEMAFRHGIQPGMRVLEVGPGNGRYTLAAAERLGPKGRLVTMDIEPRMIRRLQERMAGNQRIIPRQDSQTGITPAAGEGGAGPVNRHPYDTILAVVADAHHLPFRPKVFDRVYMITVIGEVPDPDRAIQSFYRVLKSGGALAFSELLTDPDYPLASTLIRNARAAGFSLQEQLGNFFHYTLIFGKAIPVG